MVAGMLLALLLPRLNAPAEGVATETETVDTEEFAEELAIAEL